jgi:hypothetical protein
MRLKQMKTSTNATLENLLAMSKENSDLAQIAFAKGDLRACNNFVTGALFYIRLHNNLM